MTGEAWRQHLQTYVAWRRATIGFTMQWETRSSRVLAIPPQARATTTDPLPDAAGDGRHRGRLRPLDPRRTAGPRAPAVRLGEDPKTDPLIDARHPALVRDRDMHLPARRPDRDGRRLGTRR